MPFKEDEGRLCDLENEETLLLEGYVFRLEGDRSLLSTPTNDPREVLDTVPERDDLLSGVLEIDVELERVFLPTEFELIDPDDREIGEALPDLKPLLTCRRDDRVRAFLAAAVIILSAFRTGLMPGCLAERDIFPSRVIWLRLSATFEMRRAWS